MRDERWKPERIGKRRDAIEKGRGREKRREGREEERGTKDRSKKGKNYLCMGETILKGDLLKQPKRKPALAASGQQ